MSFLRFFISKPFFTNIVLALVVLVLMLLGTFAWLNSSTRHGESLVVPDIRGVSIEKAAQLLESKNLRYQITDSVFFPDKAKNAIIDQNPMPEEKVKEGRVIYVTLNSSEPPHVKMPNLIDVSYRQALSILLSFGLKEGQITYKPDLAKNIVLKQLYNGQPVLPDTKVLKGSSIDLVLGDGLGSTEIDVPELTNLTYEEALFVLQGSGLATGTVEYEAGADKSTAKVYRQNPSSGAGLKISQGQTIDIYLK